MVLTVNLLILYCFKYYSHIFFEGLWQLFLKIMFGRGILILAIVVLADASFSKGLTLEQKQIKAHFTSYVKQYNKSYDTEDEIEKRLNIFTASLIEIEEHKTKNLSWTKVINKFSDWTVEEFKNAYGGGYVPKPFFSSKPRLTTISTSEFPPRKDWRDAGVITHVKRQTCGNCWAVAATEQLESYLALETGSTTAEELSVGQMTACPQNSYLCGGKGGCNGAIEPVAYQYAALFGVVSEAEYPVDVNCTGQHCTCKYDHSKMTPKVFARGYESLPQNDYKAIMNHITNVGPLSVSVAVKWEDMKPYGKGVYRECSYHKNINLNHAVQLVGYGTDDEQGDYWLVRNSWGSDWGELGGYYKLAREKELECGINNTPSNGSACPGDGQTSQKVCGMCGILFEASYPIGVSKTR